MVPALTIFLSAALLLPGILLVYLWLRTRVSIVGQDMLLRNDAPIYSRTSGIVGKPDVIERRGRYFVPVEHKSAASRGRPREWDVAQLLAYCQLVEENIGPVQSGEIVYSDGAFIIDWNSSNRKYLHDTVMLMRSGSAAMTSDMWKCRKCEFNRYCGRT